MSDSEDNERVNEISRALQSMLSEPAKTTTKTAAPRAREIKPKRTAAEKPPTAKVKAKPKAPSKAAAKPKTAQPVTKSAAATKAKKPVASDQPSAVKAATPDGVRVLQNTDFTLLAQRLRRALDDVKTGRVPTAIAPVRAVETLTGENHQLIADIKARLTILSDEIDMARADVAQKLLALDNLQRRVSFELDDLLDQLARRLDKTP
jgi:hypothetical protein